MRGIGQDSPQGYLFYARREEREMTSLTTAHTLDMNPRRGTAFAEARNPTQRRENPIDSDETPNLA